jgi:hypothetical protein
MMVHWAVRHIRRPDLDEDEGDPHPGRHVVAVTLQRVPWLERRIPFWDDAGFEGELTARRRAVARDAVLHPKRGRQVAKRKGAPTQEHPTVPIAVQPSLPASGPVY